MTKAEDIRTQAGDAIVSTRHLAAHSETAISHPRYNNGVWIVVETYSTQATAEEGHKRWEETMSGESLPYRLRAVGQRVVEEGEQDKVLHVRRSVVSVNAFTPAK